MADNHTSSDVDLISEAATEIQQALSALKTRITFLQTSVRKLERRAKAAAHRRHPHRRAVAGDAVEEEHLVILPAALAAHVVLQAAGGSGCSTKPAKAPNQPP